MGLADLATLLETEEEVVEDPFDDLRVSTHNGHTHVCCPFCGAQADSRRTDVLDFAWNHECEEEV